MNLKKLQNLEKLYFSSNDIARELKISRKSAQVTASRFISSGELFRLKRDIYILPQTLKSASEEEVFSMANILQTPSYVSLTSALCFYNLTTQQLVDYVESVGLKRTINFEVGNFLFNFKKIKEEFYLGFQRQENFFIALPEKALADSIYFSSMGTYNTDFEAIDLSKFNRRKVEEYLKLTNKTAINLWQKLIKNYKL